MDAMEPIGKTLKKIETITSKATPPTSSNTKAGGASTGSGDPNCPICGGVGFVRQDLPIDHPDFGKLQICACRQKSAIQSIQNRLYRLSNLDAYKSMTFESFLPGGRGQLSSEQSQSLETALQISRQYAQHLEDWLLLLGPYGCGKTHLASAIANFAVSLAVPTLFLTVPDLLDWLRYAYGATDVSFEQRFEEIRNIRLLVLDDLGTQNTTAWAQEKLFQILNYRYVNHLSTVLTTNQELKEIDPRISSRLQDPALVTRLQIAAPDFRRAAQDSAHPALSSLHLHIEQTFGSFGLREREKLTPEEHQNIEKAFRAAHEFSEDPKGWLVLLGKYSVGKTHLAAAIGNYRHSLGEATLFVVVPDLLDHLRATFNPNSTISYDNMFEEIRTARLLILDDLGTQSTTPWAKEKLYQIFNYRYNARLATVITSSSSMEDLDPRISSRMYDRRLCRIFLVDIPPYRSGAVPSEKRRTRKG
ncbi:MAG: ATP-binding protein [Anaerolineaceae bacterium]|nr:ATP-binding protein [Anaerolineaceae bacterium]